MLTLPTSFGSEEKRAVGQKASWEYGATQPKATVRQAEGRPLFPEPSLSHWSGTQRQFIKEKEKEFIGKKGSLDFWSDVLLL